MSVPKGLPIWRSFLTEWEVWNCSSPKGWKRRALVWDSCAIPKDQGGLKWTWLSYSTWSSPIYPPVGYLTEEEQIFQALGYRESGVRGPPTVSHLMSISALRNPLGQVLFAIQISLNSKSYLGQIFVAFVCQQITPASPLQLVTSPKQNI